MVSDPHLREDTPVCYIGDYQEEQWNSMDFISDLQEQYDCPVICAGDLFDYWKPSPNLLRLAILHLPNKFYTIYGQHDLPQHSLDLVDKCGINTLEAGKHLTVLHGVHWGQEPLGRAGLWIGEPHQKRILVWHKMNYQGKRPWPTCTDPLAAGLLRRYPRFALIVTGDNHKAFVEEYQGRLLVNPGSMMRMDADQIDYKPRVYLWYAETNTVEGVYLPIKEGVISREHLDRKKQHDGRIDAFVTSIDTDFEILTFDLIENFNEFFKVNQISDKVEEIVYWSLE